jgi:hypothetical protein
MAGFCGEVVFCGGERAHDKSDEAQTKGIRKLIWGGHI